MEFVGRKFKDEDVRLDFNRFHGCSFENCRMVFSAFGPVDFHDCEFGNRLSWKFEDAAGRTLEFLHAMYRTGEGGKQFVGNVFDIVRDDDSD